MLVTAIIGNKISIMVIKALFAFKVKDVTVLKVQINLGCMEFHKYKNGVSGKNKYYST